MPTRSTTASVFLLCAATAACVHALHSGGGSSTPGLNLTPGTTILVGEIADGSGTDGVVIGSGSSMSAEIRKDLLEFRFSVQPSKFKDLAELLAEAKEKGQEYVLYGRIPKWEDNATNWSGKRDYSSLALELYRVKDGAMVGSSNRSVQGVTVPEDWVSWLAIAAIDDVLGRTPPPW
jgi:Domain of unknown function (DUF4823)